MRDLRKLDENINQNEMYNLAKGLRERKIEFTLHSLHNGLAIVCENWDAVCHSYSYGGKEGLLEVMGLPQCCNDVIGYLNADEILKMVDELNR